MAPFIRVIGIELAEFELSRIFLEKFCPHHSKRLGIPMMKENCKEKNNFVCNFCANRTHFNRYLSTT